MASASDEHKMLLAALAHPLRRRILRTMANRVPTSPCELADALDASLSSVSYHIRVLAQTGVIEEVERRQVRGATQHFYRWALKAKWARTVLRETEDDTSTSDPKASGKGKAGGGRAGKRPKKDGSGS